MSEYFRKPCGVGFSGGSLLPEPGVGGCLALPDGWVTFPRAATGSTPVTTWVITAPSLAFQPSCSPEESSRFLRCSQQEAKESLGTEGVKIWVVLHRPEERSQLQKMDQRTSEDRDFVTGTWIPEALRRGAGSGAQVRPTWSRARTDGRCPWAGRGGSLPPHLLFLGRPVELFLLILIVLSGSQKVSGGVSAGQ